MTVRISWVFLIRVTLVCAKEPSLSLVLNAVPRVCGTAVPDRVMRRTRRHVAVHVALRGWPVEGHIGYAVRKKC